MSELVTGESDPKDAHTTFNGCQLHAVMQQCMQLCNTCLSQRAHMRLESKPWTQMRPEPAPELPLGAVHL